MSKDPAVLFYTSDFLTGTSFFTYEERGKYMTLLCEQHQLWSIPESHMLEVCDSLSSPVVKKFVKDVDGTYYNVRMREESLRRKAYCESRTHVNHKKTIRNPLADHKDIRTETETETVFIPNSFKGTEYESVWVAFMKTRARVLILENKPPDTDEETELGPARLLINVAGNDPSKRKRCLEAAISAKSKTIFDPDSSIKTPTNKILNSPQVSQAMSSEIEKKKERFKSELLKCGGDKAKELDLLFNIENQNKEFYIIAKEIYDRTNTSPKS